MEKVFYDKHTFRVLDKEITVYPAVARESPVIYLNTFAQEGERVYQTLCSTGCQDFNLVTVSGLIWNHDMAPWDIPPISDKDTPCTGGADEYLRLLINEIVPGAEEFIQGQALWRGLAGYSLGGLFALYALYQTKLFSRAASMSGSLWFPGFKEYVFSHEMKKSPDFLYLSLGDRECKTKNPYLKTVQRNTEEIHAFYEKKGIETVFRQNPGNHFKDAVQRTATGIAWIL